MSAASPSRARLFLQTVIARAYPRIIAQHRRERSWIFFEVLLNFPTLDFKSPPPLGDLRRMFEEHIMEERLGAQLRVGLMKQTVSMFQQLREGKT